MDYLFARSQMNLAIRGLSKFMVAIEEGMDASITYGWKSPRWIKSMARH